MAMTSIGDLAQGMVLRTQMTNVKRTAQTLTEELATGRISDIPGRLGGGVDALSDIDRSLKALAGYALATREASFFAAGAQSSLAHVQDVSAALAADLVKIDETSPTHQRNLAAQQAREDLGTIMAALNGQASGRSLFAGTATDRAPLQPADTLMAGLTAAAAGATTANDVISAVEAWFDDPTGFEAVVYSGSNQALGPFRIGPDETITVDLRADNPTLRVVLEGVALAALAADPAFAPDATAQATLLRRAGEKLFAVQDGLSEIRADLGFIESRVEETAARNSSSRASLEMARNDLIGADPYETASRLQEAQFQLESIYAVTARASRLSLVRFLE